MRSSGHRVVDAAYAASLQSLANHSPWTMTTGQDSLGAYFVSFVTSEFSERVTLKSSSKRQLTFLIHLLEEHWDEMLSLQEDPRRSDNHGGRSD